LRNYCQFRTQWLLLLLALSAASCGGKDNISDDGDTEFDPLGRGTDIPYEDSDSVILDSDPVVIDSDPVHQDSETDAPEPETDTGDAGPLADTESGISTEVVDIYRFAGGCFALTNKQGHRLTQNPNGGGYQFVQGEGDDGTPFFMKASDLGTYLLYDSEGGYLNAEDGPLLRATSLESDIGLLDDTYVSGGEWELRAEDIALTDKPQLYHFRHRKTGKLLAAQRLTSVIEDREQLALTSTNGCLDHPELSLDAAGTVQPHNFDDGDVYGIAEAHTHLLTNFGFGGGNIFHGSPFHRLGVEHALPDCSKYHGNGGRLDFFGYGSHASGGLDANALLHLILNGELPEHNHDTAGYPDFTEWPHAPSSTTHQTQYYMWLKRAWMGGLRLIVQHATTNAVICELMVGMEYQHARYSCNDMVAVDRIIDETYAMERYIDAQEGGRGKGFFRIIASPEQAREVIGQGKLAVILGIETSNLFNCFSVPRAGMPICNEKYIVEQLDKYYDRGVRVIFPVHKYDNAFTAGDGQRGFIELGNFINSGHWSNFVEDCPESGTRFDHGHVFFGGINGPRDDYFSPPPNNMAKFQENPIAKLLPHLEKIMAPPLPGEFCQNAGLTHLGEFLMSEMMKRGMVIELDHFPARSYNRAFEILEDNDYPAAGTHSSQGIDGSLYALGGISIFGFGHCRNPQRKGAMLDSLRQRLELMEKHGAYPALPIGLDLNGLAGTRGPRFGPNRCGSEQKDPVTYPFESYDGDVEFTEPKVGNRVLDFNTEGLVHIGLLPEMVEDARRDAESDADLEPIFRSAEAYLRMWERCEERSLILQSQL